MLRLLSILWITILTGCASINPTDTDAESQTLMVLDNSGGYSHGGQRIELFANGSVEITYYSDVAGDHHVSNGQYEIQDDVLMLRFGDRGNRNLHRVSYRGEVYWVYPNEVEKTRSVEGVALRRSALKQQGEQGVAGQRTARRE